MTKDRLIDYYYTHTFLTIWYSNRNCI